MILTAQNSTAGTASVPVQLETDGVVVQLTSTNSHVVLSGNASLVATDVSAPTATQVLRNIFASVNSGQTVGNLKIPVSAGEVIYCAFKNAGSLTIYVDAVS
jgi:hypothetical protein